MKNTTYKISENGMILLVVDYAKRKRADGEYDIILFETQYLPLSVLGEVSDGGEEKMRFAQNEAVFSKLFGKKMRFIGLVGDPHGSTEFNALHEAYQDRAFRYRSFSNPIKAAIDVIYYHSLDFSMDPLMRYRARYELEPMMKKVGGDKILQRLWLFNQKKLHRFLPKKVMIASTAEIKNDVTALADKIIKFYEPYQKIFLKSPCDAMGEGNLYFEISSKTHLIQQLNRFCKKNYGPFLIETASTIAQSTAKKKVDTYRAALAIIMNGAQEKPSVRMINLWRTISEDKELDSHQKQKRDYYGYSISSNQEGQLTSKVAKHLDIEHSKRTLFKAMSELGHAFLSGNLDEMASAVMILEEAPQSRMVATSVESKQLLLAHVKEYTHPRMPLSELFLDHTDCHNPIKRVLDNIKNLEPGRDWDLIAKAATQLVTSNYPKEYIEDQLKILVGKSQSAAEKAARRCLISNTNQHGLFRARNTASIPRQSPCQKCLIL